MLACESKTREIWQPDGPTFSRRLVVLEKFRGTGTTGIVRNDFWILTPPRGIVRNFRHLRFQDPAKPVDFFLGILGWYLRVVNGIL